MQLTWRKSLQYFKFFTLYICTCFDACLGYFSYRDSVVINVSYFFQFVDDKFRRDQISRAAAIIDSGMKFRELCTSQTLEADMAGRGDSAHGLCMQQYVSLFLL